MHSRDAARLGVISASSSVYRHDRVLTRAGVPDGLGSPPGQRLGTARPLGCLHSPGSRRRSKVRSVQRRTVKSCGQLAVSRAAAA